MLTMMHKANQYSTSTNYSLKRSDTDTSKQNESAASNVTTAGVKAHGSIAQSEANRQLIFPT